MISIVVDTGSAEDSGNTNIKIAVSQLMSAFMSHNRSREKRANQNMRQTKIEHKLVKTAGRNGSSVKERGNWFSKRWLRLYATVSASLYLV